MVLINNHTRNDRRGQSFLLGCEAPWDLSVARRRSAGAFFYGIPGSFARWGHAGTCLLRLGRTRGTLLRFSYLSVISCAHCPWLYALALALVCGVGIGTPPHDVLCSPSTPERQSLCESHRQRR
jgi:hypothetical protein